MERELTYTPKESYIRVATACPEVALADVTTNYQRIGDLFNAASDRNISLVTFPELSLTGYTLGDLVHQTALLEQAELGIDKLAKLTQERSTAMVVGFPFRLNNRLYNCAAVLADGVIKGIVPKINLPTYNEFYEDRWYDTWDQENTTVEVEGIEVPFGTNILFDIAGARVGVEICEDLWVPKPPSQDLVQKGATIIANPSASPEQIGKAKYRRNLVTLQSGTLVTGYLYAGTDVSESTAEIVMGGHQLIAANGDLIEERQPFSSERLTIAEVDIEHLNYDRRRLHMANIIGAQIIKTEVKRNQVEILRAPERNPFLPIENDIDRSERLQTAIKIQAHGLAMRVRTSGLEKIILGLSGGLDSTLALLVAYEAAELLNLNPSNLIHTITMPGLASSDRTQDNAQKLAANLGLKNIYIPINDLAKQEMYAIQHDVEDQNTVFENVQARVRTNILFNYANKNNGMVLGTGDLSEIALGWCTYNADQQSHYNVNATIPKTLVKYLVNYLAESPKYSAVKEELRNIIDTPISPELTNIKDGEISQNTEDIIGPYELHDFFLYHLIRWGDSPNKIAFLAEEAFRNIYDKETINKWFGLFIKRFTQNQFKRENMPNGPKVGGVSLSPRGDWRMPPDLYNSAIWKTN